MNANNKIKFIIIILLLIVFIPIVLAPGFGDKSPDSGNPDNGNFTNIGAGFTSISGSISNLQSNDGNYLAAHRDNLPVIEENDLESLLNITYNISNLANKGVDPIDITNLTFRIYYCISNEPTTFTCSGTQTPGTANNPHKVEIYNYTSNQYINLGAFTVNTATTTNVIESFEFISNPQDLISPNNLINIRYSTNISLGAGEDAGFGFDYAPLTILYDNINVTIDYPSASNYSSVQNELNYTIINATYLDVCIYSLNNGQSYAQTNCDGSITGISSIEGANTWIIKINDTLGNEANYSVEFTVDSIPPTINFVSPTKNSGTFTNVNTIIINATATDSISGVKNISINLYNSTFNNIKSNTSTSSPYFINYTNLADGIYYFNITSFDNFNNSDSTETRNITIDTTNPVINYQIPTDNPGVIRDRNYIEINISATDRNLDKLTIYLFNSSNILINSSTSSTSPFFINYTNLLDDQYTYNASANDSATNIGALSARTITLDTTFPSISYSTGTEINNSNKSQSNIYINVSITEVNLDTITYYLFNSTSQINSTSFNNETTSINFTNLQDGTYYYNVSINDTVSHQNSTETRTITLDTVPPEVFELKPSINSTFMSSNSIEISANVTEERTGLVSVKANVTNPIGNSQLLTLSRVSILNQTDNSTILTNKYNNSYSIPDIQGIYNVTFIAEDSASNINNTEKTQFTAYVSLTDVNIKQCDSEDSSSKGSFPNTCDGTYPANCNSTGNFLHCNENFTETHTLTNLTYAGLETNQFTTNINCFSITKVDLCYEYWSNNSALIDCAISVKDSGNASNYSIATTACPGTIENPGITCADVTSLQDWNCNDFFGTNSSGSNIKSEVSLNSSNSSALITWDVLVYNLTFEGEQTSEPDTGGGGSSKGGTTTEAPKTETFSSKNFLFTDTRIVLEEFTWNSISEGEEIIVPLTKVKSFEKLKFKSLEQTASASVKIYQNDCFFRFLGEINSCIEIETENIKTEEAEITFNVEKSWIDDNKIKDEDVSLYRLEKVWEKKETIKLNENNNFITYAGKTPEFSEFAIIGEKKSSFKGFIPFTKEELFAATEKLFSPIVLASILSSGFISMFIYWLSHRYWSRKLEKRGDSK